MSWVLDNHPLIIQKLSASERLGCGNEVYLLREDQIPVALGGNKVRIAAEFIRDMYAQDANALIMYGDRRSNLCRVLALACKAEQIPCLMITTSGPSTVPAFNERIITGLDVDIIQCEQGSIADAVDEAQERFANLGYRPYYIYGSRMGTGNEGTAANAYANVYKQILAWEDEHQVAFDIIVLPYGTGATQGGLVAGSLAARDNREIIGISISSRTPQRAMSILADSVASWFDKEGLDCPADYLKALHLECGYNCGGYGVPDKRVDETIRLMLQYAAIPLDPVYSGKAFLGMRDYLHDNDVRDKRILFVHTGGLPIFFDHLGTLYKENSC